MQFAEYGFDNDFIRTRTLTFAPKVGYAWTHSGGDGGRAYYYGADLLVNHALPFNFGLETNVYLSSVHANRHYFDFKKSQLQVDVEVLLTNKTPIIQGDRATLSFAFEGGYDSYKMSNRKMFDYAARQNIGSRWEYDSKSKYSLYAQPSLVVDYQATDNVNLFVGAGAEWRNVVEVSQEAQGWEVQPVGWAGFRVNF